MRVIFFGTPDFAVPPLEALRDGPDNVVAVVTKPDKPAGRGRKVSAPPVKQVAAAAGFVVLQPTQVRGNAEFLDELRSLSPDLIVVVAYGKILPKDLLDIPTHGCINVHASLLPAYRGAGPIQWAIIRGESVTGITTMQMDEGMDTGDMLLSEEIPIGARETAGELFDRLAPLGARVLMKTLEPLRAGNPVKPRPQDHSAATNAPMLKKEDGRIDWGKSTAEVFNHIRGVTPWPGAFTVADGLVVKIHAAAQAEAVLEPGCTHIESERLLVGTGDGSVVIEELQLEGRRRMTAAEFLRGHSLPERLGT